MKYRNIIQTQNYINGKFVSHTTKLPVYNKYSQELLAEIPLANAHQIKDAITSNASAFQIMRNYSAGKRAEFLETIYQKLSEKKEAFAELIALEGGKPISYARSEVMRGLDNIKTGIRETYQFSGEIVPIDYLNGQGKTAYTIRKPLGAVLAITPFNFPLNLALHKIIPAIAIGTSITVKIPPQAPLTMLAFAKIIDEAGLPAGAVNILYTNNELAEKLVLDNTFKILSFTGSDKVGFMLKKLAENKKVFLELGGNAAAIVDKTANLQRAARKLVYGSFLNAGQICISTQRIFVLNNVYDEFLNYFLEETGKVKSGYMLDEDVINSSMISKSDVERIEKYIKSATLKGAKILTGGHIANVKANLFEPTVLTGTNNTMEIYKNEAFAPVVVIEKVKDFDEAVKKVNDSKYGLQAGVFTDSYENIQKAIQDIEVGGVIFNESPGFRIDSMPYGGIKNSGIGKEGAKYVMREFTEEKLIVL